MLEALVSLDHRLFSLINSAHAPGADVLMQALSNKLYWIPFYLIAAVFLVKKRGGRIAFLAAITILLTVVLADMVSVHLFKNVFERLRPSHDPLLADSIRLLSDPQGNLTRGGTYGFVSSHAVNHFTLAVLFGFFIWTRGWQRLLLLLWAVVIAYSRVYLGLHFPGDVLVGGMLGVLMSGLAIGLWKKTLPGITT